MRLTVTWKRKRPVLSRDDAAHDVAQGDWRTNSLLGQIHSQGSKP